MSVDPCRDCGLCCKKMILEIEHVDVVREPRLLPDFCTLGDDKFLAVIRLARNYLDVKRSLAAAEDEIARLRHKLKTAEK